MGKTSLVSNFSALHADIFPGGTKYFDFFGDPHRTLADFLKSSFVSTEQKALVVFDELPLGRSELVPQILKALSHFPRASAILVSEGDLFGLPPNAVHIRLNGLRLEEWRLALATGFDALSDEAIARYFNYFNASPAGLNSVLHRLAVSGPDEADLLKDLAPFQKIGILGPDGRPYDPKTPLLPEPVVQVCSHLEEKLFEAVTKDPDLMYRISPREFELLVAELLTRDGYEVQVTPFSKDGGVDIFAAKTMTLGRLLFLVECKRYAPSNPVQVDVVRALHGNVSARQATGGVVVTTSRFTRGAKQFQQSIKHQMQLHDYANLRGWLDRLR